MVMYKEKKEVKNQLIKYYINMEKKQLQMKLNNIPQKKKIINNLFKN